MLIPVFVVAEAFPLPLPVYQESAETSAAERQKRRLRRRQQPVTTAEVAEPAAEETKAATEAEQSSGTNSVEAPETEIQEQNYADLLAGKFSLDGEPFQLPFPVKEMMDAGWQLEDEYADEVFDAEAGTLRAGVLFSNGESKFFANVRPISIDKLAYAEGEICLVSSFDPDQAIVHSSPLTFPGNISIGSSPDDILEAYGEPHSMIDLWGYGREKLLYEYGVSRGGARKHSNYGEFRFHDDPALREMTLQVTAPTWPEDQIDGRDVVYPGDVRAYNPESTDAKRSLSLTIDDDPMVFCFPTAVLFRNGWQVAASENPSVDWEAGERVQSFSTRDQPASHFSQKP